MIQALQYVKNKQICWLFKEYINSIELAENTG